MFNGSGNNCVSQTLNPARDETLVVSAVVKDTSVFVIPGLLLFIGISSGTNITVLYSTVLSTFVSAGQRAPIRLVF